MKLLEDKIRAEGRALNGHVLLVDMFLNHQVDCSLMAEIGKEFKRIFDDTGITRVVTIESSGIAPSAFTAIEFNVPLVILKKSTSVILNSDVLQTEVFSFTKRTSYQLTLKPEFIKKDDKVLLIDDFMANGEAASGAARLIERAGATVAGIGIVISKNFQPGLETLKKAGYNVHALAEVAEMGEGYIKFAHEVQ